MFLASYIALGILLLILFLLTWALNVQHNRVNKWKTRAYLERHKRDADSDFNDSWHWAE